MLHAETPCVFHVVHPVVYPANRIMRGIAAATSLPLIPPMEWINTIRALSSPAASDAFIIWLKQALTCKEIDYSFAFAKTLAASKTMWLLADGGMSMVEEHDVKRWVDWLDNQLKQRGAGRFSQVAKL